MTIAEFSASRGVERQAVTKYIKRHPEIKKHTSTEGRTIELSDEAIELLSKAYPIPKPVQVIEGVPKDEYERVLKLLTTVQAQLIESQNARIEDAKRLSEAESKAALLEDSKHQIVAQVESLQTELDRLHRRSLWQRIIDA